MTHYKSNLRDLQFNLFEASRVQDWLGTAPFDSLDQDTAMSLVTEFDRLCRGPIAESFVDGDRNPPVFDAPTHAVTLPASLSRSIIALQDGGWPRLFVPERLGGFGAPPSVVWACWELLLGANPAVFLYGVTGAAFAAVLDAIGTPAQRRLAQVAIDRNWAGTMVLTEPDAGSDVGSILTRATEQPDGSWHLEGVKRFITSGDWDLPENIFHLVLARPIGAREGTKGLSLFVVPKHHYDPDTFELGERNGVYVTNVERKMGLKASSTCELTFGEGEPAVGYLVGGVHDGIAQMFRVIESARMMVGTKAIATLSTGYLNALDYAKTRLQGASLVQSSDADAPRVPITAHADVRRSLMLQKSYAEGMRALYFYACSWQDRILLDTARSTAAPAATEANNTDGGTTVHAAGVDPELCKRVNDLLLPVVKGFGSERSYALLGAESLQVFGGSGYLQEYPLEQYIRDAKIDTLYEGTTAIQGMDFFFRKIVKDKGRALVVVVGEIQASIDNECGNGQLKDERAYLATALADTQAMVSAMVGQLTSTQEDPANVHKVAQNTTRLLLAVGDLLCGWLLLQHADIALAALGQEKTSERDRSFYDGKVASARFFASQVLPRLSVERQLVERTDNALMDLAEASF